MFPLSFPFLGTFRSCFQTRAALQLEILALRHQINVLQRSQRGRCSTDGGGPPLVGMAAARMVRLAFCAHPRQAGNGHCLTSPGMPPVLDMEE